MKKGKDSRSPSDVSSLNFSGASPDTSPEWSSRPGSLIGSDDDADTKRSKNKKDSSCCQKMFMNTELNAVNLSFNPIDPGNWDDWGVYYCSSRFGRHTVFNPNYFALTAIIVVGQSNFFDLIHLMHKNGGVAFLIILLIVYIAFGIPTYVLQTTIGQYSGRKPILMIQLMMPLFSGLGVGFYIRTFFRALISLGSSSISLYHFWELLFCKSVNNVLLKKIVLHERDYSKFYLFSELNHPITTGVEEEFALDKLILFVFTFVLFVCFYKLNTFGGSLKIILRLLLLFLAGYTFNGYNRLHPSVDTAEREKQQSIIFLPLRMTFKADWSAIVNGSVWVEALSFVINNLELASLVHMYLGSKVFFHYRSIRDGLYLTLVSLTWNLIGVVGVLLWLGYVCIDEKELHSCFRELQGHYGLLVVFIMKHLQAEMSEEIESDVLAFCSIFYLIVGLAGMLATIGYIYILCDCTYPESGFPIMKLCSIFWHILVFGCVCFPLALSDAGLHHIIFLNHYAGSSWGGTFLVLCFLCGVLFGHGMARFIHDFFNIYHLRGFELKSVHIEVPRIVGIVYLIVPVIVLLKQFFTTMELKQGPTDWSDSSSVIFGHFLSFLPLLAVAFGAIHYLIREKRAKRGREYWFKPHRDFYKNKHHISVCLKDYQLFNLNAAPPIVATQRKSFIRRSRTF